jgi:pyruvate,orthophosphate dikinase
MFEVKIFKFGSVTDGDGTMKEVLGGKGAGLAEMSNLGLPVPPGFTLPCYLSLVAENPPPTFDAELTEAVLAGIKFLKSEGNGTIPLLSVRSGSRESMPGMMDTILNVGITTKNIETWEARLGARAAWDCYRRLIQMYGTVAMGVPMSYYDHELEEAKIAAGVQTDQELDLQDLQALVTAYLYRTKTEAGKPFPDTLEEQVMGSVYAVFNSWNNQRAKDYRKAENIPDSWGTACTVQTMVFGNLNDNCCSGVVFSRNKTTGEEEFFGDFLPNAQGEDVVAGIRTPLSINEMG